jgi:hypothetical protein
MMSGHADGAMAARETTAAILRLISRLEPRRNGARRPPDPEASSVSAVGHDLYAGVAAQPLGDGGIECHAALELRGPSHEDVVIDVHHRGSVGVRVPAH